MKFKFLNLGQRVKIYVNNNLAQTNTLYENSDTITVKKNNNAQFGEPFDDIQYQGYYEEASGNITSNIAKIIVNFPPNKTINPISSNNQITILNNTEINIINHITYNAAVDRIKIVSFNNVGELTFNSNYIFSGKEIMQYDFDELKFKAGASGIGFPYQEIKFQVGNINGYNPTIYFLEINIDGLASLIEVDDPDIVSNEQSKSIIYNLQVKNGVINKTAKIKVEVNLPPEVFLDADSQVQFSYKNNFITISDNGIFEVTTVLNQNGEDELLLEIDLFLQNNNIDGFVKFTLLEVNNDNSLVSTINEQTLILNSI